MRKVRRKFCPDCQRYRSANDFGRNFGNSDGLAAYCRDCFKVRQRASRKRRAAAEGRVLRPRREVPSGYKYCPGCEQTKLITAFGRNRSTRDGLTAYCKPCHNAKGKETYTRLYGGTRHYHLRRRYGIGVEDFDRLVAEQGGVCAICGAPDPQHVDHDHVTGAVRGVLCFNCNGGLGQFRDDIDALSGAITYLEEFSWRTTPEPSGVSRLRSLCLAPPRSASS